MRFREKRKEAKKEAKMLSRADELSNSVIRTLAEKETIDAELAKHLQAIDAQRTTLDERLSLIARPLGKDTGYSDAQLETEYEKLAEGLPHDSGSVTTPSSRASSPDLERELAELEAELGMLGDSTSLDSRSATSTSVSPQSPELNPKTAAKLAALEAYLESEGIEELTPEIIRENNRLAARVSRAEFKKIDRDVEKAALELPDSAVQAEYEALERELGMRRTPASASSSSLSSTRNASPTSVPAPLAKVSPTKATATIADIVRDNPLAIAGLKSIVTNPLPAYPVKTSMPPKPVHKKGPLASF